MQTSQELAQVVGVEGDYLILAKAPTHSCHGCQQQSQCGTGLLNGYFGKRLRTLRLYNHCHARVGDTVSLAIQERALLNISLLTYLPVLAFLVIGMLLGFYLAPAGLQNPAAIVGLVLGLAVGAGWLRALAGVFQARADGLIRVAVFQSI